MPTYYGIDPGEERSGVVTYVVPEPKHRGFVTDAAWVFNTDLYYMLCRLKYGTVGVIEDVASYGSAMGPALRRTIEWIGILTYRWDQERDQAIHRVSRPDVKLHLLGNRAGTSGHVHAALYERFGGDVRAAKGTKDNPGPCYRVSGHAWDALAVAVTYHERSRDGEG